MSGASIEARFRLPYPDFTLEVDLELPGRGITALFGHSGSGKTTLLRCIAGLDRPPAGRLVVQDEVWQDEVTFVPTHRRPLGYVFQEGSLFPHLTALGNIEFGLKRAADVLPPAALRHIIDLLGIGPLLARRPDQLSGGERQRVAIARALALKPQLLLMDEPLSALDLKRKREILPYLERLHGELAIPILYVTHAPDEVARLADHLVVLEAGRALASGPLTETLARLDLPIHGEEDAGVVLEASVAERDEAWHLARAEFPGGSLWVRDDGIAVGKRLRLRVLARDVSLTTARPERTSILNLLPATVVALAADGHPSQRTARVQVGETPLLARITARSVAALQLVPGTPVWVQVKSVAVLE
ncbi:MAG: molybdenum ABC transporter ATP-binding protein [Gammaproteobacteria bacterium]|nr:molybdenum ABC transporter ATP-binding protein [Gammaproteobacteria bacterium]